MFPLVNSSGAKYKSPKKKGCGCLTGIIIFILIIGLAGSCSDSDKEDSSKKNTASKKVTAVESITLSADTSTVYDINTEIPIDMAVNPADGNIDKLSCEVLVVYLKTKMENLLSLPIQPALMIFLFLR